MKTNSYLQSLNVEAKCKEILKLIIFKNTSLVDSYGESITQNFYINYFFSSCWRHYI